MSAWVSREEAKKALDLSEEEFSKRVYKGKILTHRTGKWTMGGRHTLYFIGSVPGKEEGS